MDGPDASVTLTTGPLALQGSTQTVRATFTSHEADGSMATVAPQRVRLVLVYEGADPPQRRTVEVGADRPTASVRVLEDGSVLATFVPSYRGALLVRIEGTVDVGGVSFAKAAQTRLYVRRSGAAAA